MSNLAKIKGDFRVFLWVIWKHLNLPAPTPVQYDIAQYISRGPRRRMIQAFRGVGKSWLTAAYVLWRLLKNPNERILVVSASKDRADAFSVFVKRLINDVEILQHLRAKEGQRDSNIAFDVGPSDPHQAPSVRSVGITGQLTGGRATIIIADDVEVPKNSLTQTMRDKLSEAVKEFDAVLVPDGEIIYLGTPQTEMSLYNSLPERGYEIRIWPARFVSPENFDKYGGRLAPFVTEPVLRDLTLASGCHGRGAPVEPGRFTDLDLLEREASYGRSGFALQFMLDTSLSDQDRYPLKLNDLIVMDIDHAMAPVKVAWAGSREYWVEDLDSPGLNGDRFVRPMFVAQEWSPYQGTVMFIDPSGRGKDETGWAIIKCLHGMLYLIDAGGYKDGYSEATLTSLANSAAAYKVNSVVTEDNFGDGMFNELFKPYLKRIHPAHIEPEGWRNSGQKERRIIDTLEPVMNQHRLVVNRALIKKDLTNYNQHAGDSWEKYSLFYQMSRITKEKGALAHDDRLEAVAGAVAFWIESMNRDLEVVVKEHREKLLDEDLRKFVDFCTGGSGEGQTIFD